MTLAAEWTDEALMAIRHIGKAELINGKVIMAPAGAEHGGISVILANAMANAVLPTRLGQVFDSSTGFRMTSGNVLSPDVAFVSREKLKVHRKDYKRFLKCAPDIVAEILSPNDSRRETVDKIEEYFQNGTSLAWIIDPEQKTIDRFTSPGSPAATLTVADTLTAPTLLPTFRLPLADLFRSPFD